MEYLLGTLLKRIDLSFLRRFTDGTRKKALFYYASSSLVCQTLRFLGVLITTRAIVPEQFGLFAQATLLISIAGLLREVGQTGALVAYQGSDQRYAYFNFQTNLFLGCAAGCHYGHRSANHACQRRSVSLRMAVRRYDSEDPGERPQFGRHDFQQKAGHEYNHCSAGLTTKPTYDKY
jgi:hypothetical protein